MRMATQLNHFNLLPFCFQLAHNVQLRTGPSVPDDAHYELLNALRRSVLIRPLRQIIHLRTRGKTLIDRMNTNTTPQTRHRMEKFQDSSDCREAGRELQPHLSPFLHLHGAAQARHDVFQERSLIVMTIEEQTQVLSREQQSGREYQRYLSAAIRRRGDRELLRMISLASYRAEHSARATVMQRHFKDIG